jgi:predicted enzyme related to lactoylglutathione lyase
MPNPTRFLSVSPLIPARDVEEGIAFYQRAFGFELFYRDAEPAAFAIVGSDSARLHLFASQDKHLADWTSLRIEVDGIDALHGRCLMPAACIRTARWARGRGARASSRSSIRAGCVLRWWSRTLRRAEGRARCLQVVPPAGIEPARLSALDFESSASTNSATEAASAGAHLSTCDAKKTSARAGGIGV